MSSKVTAVVLHGKVVAKQLDLNTTTGLKAFEQSMIEHHRKKVSSPFFAKGLFDFLRTFKQPPLCHGKDLIFIESEAVLRLKGRCLYSVDDPPYSTVDPALKTVASKSVRVSTDGLLPNAVLITDCNRRTPKNKDFRAILLLNGDADCSQVAECVDCEIPDFPTISFECLAQFYDALFSTSVSYLAKERVKLLDYVPDETIPLTNEEKKVLKSKLKLKPPHPGFTLVQKKWHRAGTVLLHDTKKDWYLLMGRDEGTYFGIQLCEPCKSIDVAFKSLIPKELQGRSDFVRQGEWFIVPVPAEEVPSEKNAAVLFETGRWSDTQLTLPVDDPESNPHSICGKGRVSKDGKVYAKDAGLHHDEHVEQGINGWCTFIRNTAVRSVSQKGVD